MSASAAWGTWNDPDAAPNVLSAIPDLGPANGDGSGPLT